MSYNCDDVSYIGDGRLSITPENLLKACDMADEGHAPECNFIDDLPEVEGPFGLPIVLESLDWSGEWSGYTFRLFKNILALTTGTAELVLSWEHGDSVSGMRIVDGVVTEHKVIHALGEQTK